MIYENIRKAVFLSRPNRFIAHVKLDGKDTVCHVKNTGRCRELLIPGAAVYIQQAQNPERKTRWDLIAVEKGERLINMDAAAPNAVFGEWLSAGGAGFVPDLIRPEYVHGDSRFDFYLEQGGRRIFAEVKGVTLEEAGVVRFPDAPTERGVKHLRGLASCVAEGFEAWAVFVIQMQNVEHFEPNRATHPAFADALRDAEASGVRLLALDCEVTPQSVRIHREVPIKLVRVFPFLLYSFIPLPFHFSFFTFHFSLPYPPGGLAKCADCVYSLVEIQRKREAYARARARTRYGTGLLSRSRRRPCAQPSGGARTGP